MLAVLSLCELSAAAFTPALSVTASQCAPTRSSVPLCLLDDAAASRRAVLGGVVGAALGVAGVGPASAGYISNLGIEVTKPADAEKDDELLESKEVQQGLTNLKGYKSAAASLKSQFDADQNMNLIPAIRKQFDFGKVRDDLNVLSAVFDDTTQATTDRLSRAVLYDLTELENASRFKKDDPARTAKKIANVERWFTKLDTDISTFLSYF